MNILFRKLKFLAIVIGIPWLLVAGCAFGFVGNDGAKHISDNNTMVRQQQIASDERVAAERAAAKVAAAEARANADMHRASERTQQTLLVQNASSERLLLQSQHLLAVREAGTQRLQMFLVTVVILAILGGGVLLVIYLRNNPRRGYALLPHVPQNVLPMSGGLIGHSTSNVETLSPVPYSVFVGNPDFQAHGWTVHGPDTGVRIVNGQIVAKCHLLEG